MATSGRRGVHGPPGEGRRLWTAGGTYTLKATTENTSDALFTMESIMPPQGGHAPHVRRRMHRQFYIPEGTPRPSAVGAPS